MVSPAVLVNSQVTTNGVDVLSAQTVIIQLQDLTGVNSWSISCVSTDELQDVDAVNAGLVIDNVAKTCTFTMPTETTGVALIFESKVNGGLTNGVRDSLLITRIKICTVSSATNTRVMAADETIEGNAEFGWITVTNNPIRYGAGGGGGSPTGPAGGDLSGTYPNPQIATGVIVNADVNASAAIAHTKLATITTDSILGRDTAGTGTLETITLGASLSMTGTQVLQRAALTGDVTAATGSNSTTVTDLTITGEQQGSVLYFNGTNWVQLTPGTDGYALTTHGAAANPTWSNVTGTGGPPSGAAGGDLTGTYPNPTIGANKTTFAKMQQVATDSLLGRDTAGTGNIENILLNATLSMDGAGNLQRSALTGDITSSAGSNTTAIAAGVIVDADVNASAAIAYSKLATIATDRLLGRDTAGTGALEALSVSGGLEFTGSTGIQRSAITGDVSIAAGATTSTVTDLTITGEQQGSVLYFNGSNWVQLAPGTDGYQLTTHSTGANPTWAASGGGAPSGAAGGDLSGTYPNPDIAAGAIVNADVNASAAIAFTKLATITTDSLLGRDTASTGTLEAITLNSTLEFTGSQVIQRAALSGDITASAGSNTTAITAGVIVDADVNASAAISLSKLATQAALSVVANGTNATAVPTALAAATDGNILRRSGTAVAFGSIDLASAGTVGSTLLPLANLASLAGLSVLGRSANTTGVQAAITGTDGQALRVSGTTLGFGTLATAAYTDASVTYAKIANGTGLSVIGRSANTSGVNADITGTDGQVLRVSGTTLAFGTIATAGITDASITMAKLANLAGLSVIGRNANTTGVPAAITATTTGQVLINNGTTVDFGSPNFGALNIVSTGSLTIAGITNSGAYAGGTNPASAGIIRLPNASAIAARNAANSADFNLVSSNASNEVILGNTSDTSIIVTDSSDLITFKAANATQLTINTTTLDAQDNNIVSTGSISLGTNPSSTGIIALANSSNIRFRNAANSGNVDAIAVDSSNNLILGNSSDTSLQINDSTDTLLFKTANASTAQFYSGGLEVFQSSIKFDTAATAPFFWQEDKTTNAGTGATLTLQAQNETGTTSTGGQLILSSGTGTSADGYWTAKRGSTTIINATPNSLEIGDVSLPMIEVATLATNRDIVSLCAGSTLSTTQMPANTGDMVVYLGNAATEPTTGNPVSGNILWSVSSTTASALKTKNTLNVNWSLMPGAAWNKYHLSGNGNTTSVVATTVATLNFSQFGNGSGDVIFRVMSRDVTNSQGCAVYGFSYTVQGGALISGTTTPTALYGNNSLLAAATLGYPGSGNIDFKVAAADTNTNTFYILAEVTYHLNS